MIKLKKVQPGLRNKKRAKSLIKNKVDAELCQRFRQIRKDNNLTQHDYADILGTTRVSVNAIERGDYNPGIDMLRTLRAKYKMSYDYLIDGK